MRAAQCVVCGACRVAWRTWGRAVRLAAVVVVDMVGVVGVVVVVVVKAEVKGSPFPPRAVFVISCKRQWRITARGGAVGTAGRRIRLAGAAVTAIVQSQ